MSKNKKVITGTTVARWVGRLAVVVVTIALVVLFINAIRNGESIVDVITENWAWLFGGYISGGLCLGLTPKKDEPARGEL